MLAITGLLDFEIWGRGELGLLYAIKLYTFLEPQNFLPVYSTRWWTTNCESASRCQAAVVNKMIQISWHSTSLAFYVRLSSWGIAHVEQLFDDEHSKCFDAVPMWLPQRCIPALSMVGRRISLKHASLLPSNPRLTRLSIELRTWVQYPRRSQSCIPSAK